MDSSDAPGNLWTSREGILSALPGRTAGMTTETESGSVKVADLAKDVKFAMLTTIDADGELVSRPMAQQAVETDGDLWFFASRDSRKVSHIRANPHVAVTLSSSSTWVSINGSAEVVEDDALARELWSPGIEAWFPQGPDDDSIVMIKVNGETAEYWDTPGGQVATVLSLVKSKLTGKRYSGGENDKIDLTTAG